MSESTNQEYQGDQTQAKERRQSVREDLLLKAINARIYNPQGELIMGKVQDLSERGSLINSNTSGLKIDDQIRVVFIFPLNHKIEYQCVVRHITPGENIGVEFLT